MSERDLSGLWFTPVYTAPLRSHDLIVILVNRIASLAASYVSSMYRIVGYTSRLQLWRSTSLIYSVQPMRIYVLLKTCMILCDYNYSTVFIKFTTEV